MIECIKQDCFWQNDKKGNEGRKEETRRVEGSKKGFKGRKGSKGSRNHATFVRAYFRAQFKAPFHPVASPIFAFAVTPQGIIMS